MQSITCFKAYDIRGIVPDELNPVLAYKIGRATAQFLSAKTFVVGRDVRSSGPEINQSLIQGLIDSGVDVFDIGLCGTEMVYFATSHLKADGGIMITASHNPPEYNGMKFVREGSRPISGDTGLKDIEQLCLKNDFPASNQKGSVKNVDVMDDYIKHLLIDVDIESLKPMKVVVNAGNGCAGPVLDQLEKYLPFQFIKVNHQPDPDFPNGIPNPMLIENRKSTSEMVIEHQAVAGIAWDGDYDRCFFFDENGRFIEGYYIVGFLAQAMLKKQPGGKIVHDPRLIWNTIELVEENGGIPIQTRSGHAFIKECMRQEDAIYGGEMSAHHYFKDFFFCDSGMIPWLLILETLCKTGNTLSSLVHERIELYPVSGEINRKVRDPNHAIEQVRHFYSDQNPELDHTDGISFKFPQWRFNIRQSQTEPILRLNVESRGDKDLMEEKTEEVLKIIDGAS